MIDLSSIEQRLSHIEGTVVSDLEREAHTRVGTALLSAAREVIDVLPDGAEAEQLVESLVSIGETAHSVIHAAAAAGDPNAPVESAAPVGDTTTADLPAAGSAPTA